MSKKAKNLLILLFWLVLWQLFASLNSNALLLPGPIDTVKALIRLLAETQFYSDVLATIARCVAAILLALASGFLLALAAYRWRWLRDILSLPVAFLKAVPVMAIAIYLLLLISSGGVPVFVCWAMCFPIVYTNLLMGLDSMDAGLMEMAKLYEINGVRKLKYIYAPAMHPFFNSALSIIAGMSWKAVVTAEVLSIPRFSLGYELMNAKYYLNTDELFAYVMVIISLSLVFESLIKRGVGLLAPRKYEYSKLLRRDASDEALETCGHSCELDQESCSHSCKLELEAPDIVLRDIGKIYGDKQVLDGFNLELEAGKVTAIMGASGSGKTTITRIVGGLEDVQSGEITGGTGRAAMLFQEDRLLPWLNVYDNLAIALKECTASGKNSCINYANKRILSALEAVGLSGEQYKLPTELSGGMSRRVAIAKALLFESGLVIADEPFRGLDEETRRSVIDRLWTPGVAGRTVLLITHSREDAEELADKLVEM